MKDKIQITYFGDEAPIVKCDNLADAERIELIDGEEGRWLFLDYGGVKVYHTNNCNHPDMISEVWFSTERGHESDEEGVFEWCDFPSIPEDEAAKYKALFPDDSEKQQMAYAIDAGYVTGDGLSDTCKECGVPIGEAGDGQDGLCGNCADKAGKAKCKHDWETIRSFGATVGYDARCKKCGEEATFTPEDEQ